MHRAAFTFEPLTAHCQSSHHGTPAAARAIARGKHALTCVQTAGDNLRTVIRQIVRDAIALTRACALPPSFRSTVRVMLHTDSFPVLVVERVRQASRRLGIPGVSRILRYSQMAVFGIEVGKDVELGDGVYFVHTLGTVIGGNARLGARVRLMGNNTIGTAKDNGYPVIEDDVVIGVGARVLGPVRIGARAKIGANAVVLHDVPADAVATGIPAVVHGLSRSGDVANQQLESESRSVTPLRRSRPA